MKHTEGITLNFLEGTALKAFPLHPFDMLEKRNCAGLFQHYLGMSESFPYLLAGSQHHLVMNCIRTNTPVPDHIADTSVVANFLAWDETGGYYLMRKLGIGGLLEICDREHSHVKLLRRDIEKLFLSDIQPSYAEPTGSYLSWLAEGLAANDPVRRCAFLVSFEVHAGRMIESLWKSVRCLLGGDELDLTYFRAHVGGDDPAEPLHARMVNKMLGRVIGAEDSQAFLDIFVSAYAGHVNWCRNIGQTDPFS